MIEAKMVFEEFQKYRGNSIVHVQGTSGHHWNNISTKSNRDIMLGGAMGQSTSAVFGLALGLQDEKVVHFDTEGALLMNLGVLASGNGSNFEALVKATRNSVLDANISLLVVSDPECNAISRAKKLSIP